MDWPLVRGCKIAKGRLGHVGRRSCSRFGEGQNLVVPKWPEVEGELGHERARLDKVFGSHINRLYSGV